MAFDSVEEPLERVCADRTLLAGFLHRCDQLLPLILLAASIALDDLGHHAVDAFAGRESAAALEALTASADFRALAAQP